MFLTLSRGVWFVSILSVLAALLYVYASLPEEVLVSGTAPELVYLGKESLFYLALGAITFVNSLVFLVSALYKKDTALRGWFNGLITVLNIFFISSLLILNAINGTDRFDLARVGFIIYGSLALIAVWAMGWPVYFLIRKFSGKPTI